jgi:hypothetical protein
MGMSYCAARNGKEMLGSLGTTSLHRKQQIFCTQK